MDGPHLVRPGRVCRGQAVLFKSWLSGSGMTLLMENVGHRMGHVVEVDGDTVYLDCEGQRLRTRMSDLHTHPDMVPLTRLRKIEMISPAT